MTRPTTFAKGAPCWIDLYTSDPDRVREFYTGLFGWTAEDPDPQHGGYFNFRKDGLRVAGCMGRMPEQPGPDAWSVHLSTPDVRQTLEDAQAHGGQVLLDAHGVDDLGTMSLIADPSGAAIGAWQPGSHVGFGAVYEDNAPTWFELHTRDYDAAVQFYRDVFGWTTVTASDTPELRYTLFQAGETPLAGIMDDTQHTHESVPSHWTAYFGVADADAAAVKIRKLGGSLSVEPIDTPYGRLVGAVDPTGATFNLMQANREAPAGLEPAASSNAG